ncbi:hypothetical protein B0H34DRAFT_669403, partial [Crassisporium funariophilum]
PRTPRTHTSPAVIEALKKLSLSSILQKNKKIEAQNDARLLKTLEHEEDPVANPQPGSETASLVTIDAENMNRLKVPAFFNTFWDWVYPSLAKFFADEELKDKEEKLKRKITSDPADTQSPEEVLRTKRRCMDGSNMVEKVIGVYNPLEFAQCLFDTELHVAVPLPFFVNKNLQILIDEPPHSQLSNATCYRVKQREFIFLTSRSSRPVSAKNCHSHAASTPRPP